MLFQLLEPAIRNVLAGLLVGLGAPVIVLELHLERSVEGGELGQHLNTSINHFWTNAIRAHGRDGITPGNSYWRHI
jgi:hypothetical protein